MVLRQTPLMTQSDNGAGTSVSMEEIQQGWNDLKDKVEQAAAERSALEAENKALRFLLERLIEHRQRSHGDLVNFLADPSLLKNLEERRRNLKEAVQPVVEEMIRLDSPLEQSVLETLIEDPAAFFSPAVVRANRCFVKGQLPRERVVREFGEAALACFNDLTTDKRFNPRPKPEEIVLGFKDDFESLLESDTALKPEVKAALQSLFLKVQRSKSTSAEALAQRQTFAKLSFLMELWRFYDEQNTEAPDAVFAQRLPAAVEQLAVPDPQTPLDETVVERVEDLLFFIVRPEHRHMVVNNLGKGGGASRTLKHILHLRLNHSADLEHSLNEFVRHLIPGAPEPLPPAADLVRKIRLIPADMQRLLVGSIMSSDRRLRAELTALGTAVAKELGLKDLESIQNASTEIPPEMERRMAWEEVHDLINKRSEASVIAAAIRQRLHARYDVDEVKAAWLTLTEADAVSFIRIFCQLPYLPGGKTDPVAHAVMQIFMGRLMHEKYAAFYQKVLTSLKNMHKANPNSPTLTNFLAMARWADVEAAASIGADIGLHPA